MKRTLASIESRPFPATIPRAARRVAGAATAERTPLNVRTGGVELDEEVIERVRTQLGRRLGRLAPRIERLTVRYEEESGPRGSFGTVCRVKVVLAGLPSVVFEARGHDENEVSNLAIEGIARAVKKALERARSRETVRAKRVPAAPRPERTPRGGRAIAKAPEPPPEGGTSRKSTRKGPRGPKSDLKLRRRQVRAVSAPSARARRSKTARA